MKTPYSVQKKLARDSIVWDVGWVTGILGYLVTNLLATKKPPTEWTYLEWLQFILVVLTGVSGKNAWSNRPLKRHIGRSQDYIGVRDSNGYCIGRED